MPPVPDFGEIRIRPYALTDADTLWAAVRESLTELTPWMPWAHPHYAIHETRTWLDAQVSAFAAGIADQFAIVSGDGAYLGACGLNQLDQQNRRANLGYWVRTSVARRGVASAAVGLLRTWAFRETDLLRLEVLVAAGNVASRRVALRTGATEEGLLQSRLVIHGAVHDAVLYSFVKGRDEG